MQCRSGCGACCIAPSISSPIPGMPAGKPANTRCLQLTEDLRCGIFGQPERPQACLDFDADLEVCGENREQALQILQRWEELTLTPVSRDKPSS